MKTIPHLQAIGAVIGYHRTPTAYIDVRYLSHVCGGLAEYLNAFFGLVHTINGNTPFAILIFYHKKGVNKFISLLLILYIVYME